jgi:hypothetical protein
MYDMSSDRDQISPTSTTDLADMVNIALAMANEMPQSLLDRIRPVEQQLLGQDFAPTLENQQNIVRCWEIIAMLYRRQEMWREAYEALHLAYISACEAGLSVSGIYAALTDTAAHIGHYREAREYTAALSREARSQFTQNPADETQRRALFALLLQAAQYALAVGDDAGAIAKLDEAKRLTDESISTAQ